MGTFVTTVHIITCALIIIVVLMQSGKGAEISATLGGSSNTVFGSSGGANFFTKATFALAALFMFTSLTLTIMGGRAKRSVFDGAPAATTSLPQEAGKPGSSAAAGAAGNTKVPTTTNAATNQKAADTAAKAAASASAEKQVE